MNEKIQRFHLALIGVSSIHKKYNMQKFNQLNLTTGQPKVLSILLKKEGYLQKDLAKRCHVEPATMTSILKNMESKSLIYKHQESVSGGKRAYSIYLTDEGREMASKVNEIVDASEEICFQGFTEEEKQQLLTLLGRIQGNLEHQLSLEEETIYE